MRRFLPYHHGVPGSRWLRLLMNRIDAGLFAACFQSWAAALRPDAPALVANDGKTSRGSHDRASGRAALHLVDTQTHEKGLTLRNRRFYVASRALSADQAADAIRRHWRIETSLHWVLDVTFNEDRCRCRTGHGPANMAVVRHFAFNLLRTIDDRRSIKLRRKRAARNNQYLEQILQPSLR